MWYLFLPLQVDFDQDLPPPPLPPKPEEEEEEMETPPERPPKPSSMSPPPVVPPVDVKRESREVESPESDVCYLPEAR